MKVLRSLVVSALFVLAFSAATFGQSRDCNCISDTGVPDEKGGWIPVSSESFYVSATVNLGSFGARSWAYGTAGGSSGSGTINTGGGVSGPYDFFSDTVSGTLPVVDGVIGYGCRTDASLEAYAEAYAYVAW